MFADDRGQNEGDASRREYEAGSTAYSVTQRTRKLGIRAALDASPGALARLVVGGALPRE